MSRSATRLKQLEQRAGILNTGICHHKMAVIRTPASDNASIICELCGLPQQKILITRMARSETHATVKKKASRK